MIWLEEVTLRGDSAELGFYPFNIAAIADLSRLELSTVTFLCGENGSGKSTLIEGMAAAAGYPVEGGAPGRNYARQESHPLGDQLDVRWSAKPVGGGFFLRAESFYGLTNDALRVARTAVSGLDFEAMQLVASFGDRPPDELSHGQGFLRLFDGRFWGRGLYFLDEPESALSFRGCLALLAAMADLAAADSQLIIATHSPVLLSLPGATIYELDEHGISARAYQETAVYRDFRDFLAVPERYLRHLLGPDRL
jgi:predicted ATPase